METVKMPASPSRREVIEQLRREITVLQGLPLTPSAQAEVDMGAILNSFPGRVFPTSTIHEYISYTPESAAASGAFVTATIAALRKTQGACVWIGRRTKVYPPALYTFGLDPDQVVFVQASGQKDALWATEEVLKTPGITAVVAEIAELTFKHSQRLQRAVEVSKVTGFLLRDNPRYVMTTAAAARWLIRPAPSYMPRDRMPGLGHAHWHGLTDSSRRPEAPRWQPPFPSPKEKQADHGKISCHMVPPPDNRLPCASAR